MTRNSTDFEIFGKKSAFAIELRLIEDPDPPRHAPKSSAGSWGEWRIWAAGNNLCRMSIFSEGDYREVESVRWFLAPLFTWLVHNWAPILHETKLPSYSISTESKERWARGSYLSEVQLNCGEETFAPWQLWARRHSLRSCAEGAIVPDVFFQRIGDDIEISWGDRIAPGAESVDFLLEEGGAHASVADVGNAFEGAVNWLLSRHDLKQYPWHADLHNAVAQRNIGGATSMLTWFLDSSSLPGRLTTIVRETNPKVTEWLNNHLNSLWLSPLTPQVAMFGALSPDISQEAAARLTGILLNSETGTPEPAELTALVEDLPGWRAASPWYEGYSLALNVLDDADPDPNKDFTDVEKLLHELRIKIYDEHLGLEGPRGVAIAGDGYLPTIISNRDHPYNLDRGDRFTLAHELCHILFDRDKAKSVFQASTPWAHPAVEKRANAFAAMLLMPPNRIDFNKSTTDIKRTIRELAIQLKVSDRSLIHHLGNLGRISEEQRDELLIH